MRGRATISPMHAVVHNCGGVALANAEAIRHAVAIVAGNETRGVAVVVSAMGGVTDTLLDITALARDGKRGAAKRAVAALRERHVAAANALIFEPELLDGILAIIDRELDELTTLASRRPSAALSDRIVARGERLSAHLMTGAFAASGIRAEFVDATRLIHASGSHGNATPIIPRSMNAI